jgi:serine/threonine protein kinase
MKTTLQKVLESGDHLPSWWNETQRAKTIVGIVHGMIDVHERGFIHYDLRANNIYFDKENNVKIGDFADSRFCPFDIELSGGGRDVIFKAPEIVWDSASASWAVDVFSFGLLLYDLAIVPYFSVKNEWESTKLWMELMSGLQLIRNESVEDWVWELIERCLSADAAKRPSFVEIWRELDSHDCALFRDVDAKEICAFVSMIMGGARPAGANMDSPTVRFHSHSPSPSPESAEND